MIASDLLRVLAALQWLTPRSLTVIAGLVSGTAGLVWLARIHNAKRSLAEAAKGRNDGAGTASGSR